MYNIDPVLTSTLANTFSCEISNLKSSSDSLKNLVF